MKRRDFLLNLALIPHIISGELPLPTLNSPLVIRKIPYFGDYKIEITKGMYRTEFFNFGNLHDCHGLCANDELTLLLIDQLEIGKERLSSLYRIRYSQKLESLRRFRLSDQEMYQIWSCINELRGEHDCVHQRSQTMSWFSLLKWSIQI